jgi:hypothetical protein
VFVGWNEYAARLAQTFKSSAASAYQVIGYIHGRADEGTEPSITYLGAFEEAELIISSIAIDILILADLDYERHRVLHLASACEREMVEFKVVPSYFQILVCGLHLETVSGIPVLGVGRLPLDRIVNRTIGRSNGWLILLVELSGSFYRSRSLRFLGRWYPWSRRVRFSIDSGGPEERKKRQAVRDH